MNIFDFDNTIYDGESTFDFYLFCVKHHPKCIKFIFVVMWSLIKYKMCLISEEKLMYLAKKYVTDFLKCCPDADKLAKKFWIKNIKKIKPFYSNVRREDDVIVTASFGFLLRPLFQTLKVKNAVMSEVNLETGEVERLCYRKNKIQCFRDMFGDARVLDVYTDSLNDKPLMSLATRNVYLAKGNKLVKYGAGEENE